MVLFKRIYLSVIIFVAAAVSLIAFMIWPVLKNIATLSRDLFLEKNKIFYLEQEKGNIQKIGKNYKTYEGDLDKIEDLFVDSAAPISFITFLEKNATDSQIELEISSLVKKTEKEDAWPSFSLKVSATGSFGNLSRFLDKIENGPYLIEIFEINSKKLTKKEEAAPGAEEVQTLTTLSIKTYTK